MIAVQGSNGTFIRRLRTCVSGVKGHAAEAASIASLASSARNAANAAMHRRSDRAVRSWKHDLLREIGNRHDAGDAPPLDHGELTLPFRDHAFVGNAGSRLNAASAILLQNSGTMTAPASVGCSGSIGDAE